MKIRPYRNEDLQVLHGINQASTPGVSSETPDTLAHWIGLSTALIAEDASGSPVGFLTLIELGTAAYDSANLRWFEARQAKEGGDTIYVDRIAVAPAMRGYRVGEALYRDAFGRFSHRGEIGCEVNIRPPNRGSQRFHARLGFRQIGERSYAGGEKSVGYWVRPLGVV
ncbi:MAG: GNAT family N-acetyltransferase [Pseudomonadota bacterium]